MTEQDKQYIAGVYRNNGQCFTNFIKEIYDIGMDYEKDQPRFCKTGQCPFKKDSRYANCNPQNVKYLALCIMKEHKDLFFEYLI